jgi:hypothetical protein
VRTAVRFPLVSQLVADQNCPSDGLEDSNGHQFSVRNINLTWGGAKGTRTPGLLHAMNHPGIP